MWQFHESLRRQRLPDPTFYPARGTWPASTSSVQLMMLRKIWFMAPDNRFNLPWVARFWRADRCQPRHCLLRLSRVDRTTTAVGLISIRRNCRVMIPARLRSVNSALVLTGQTSLWRLRHNFCHREIWHHPVFIKTESTKKLYNGKSVNLSEFWKNCTKIVKFSQI